MALAGGQCDGNPQSGEQAWTACLSRLSASRLVCGLWGRGSSLLAAVAAPQGRGRGRQPMSKFRRATSPMQAVLVSPGQPQPMWLACIAGLPTPGLAEQRRLQEHAPAHAAAQLGGKAVKGGPRHASQPSSRAEAAAGEGVAWRRGQRAGWQGRLRKQAYMSSTGRRVVSAGAKQK